MFVSMIGSTGQAISINASLVRAVSTYTVRPEVLTSIQFAPDHSILVKGDPDEVVAALNAAVR